MSVIQPNLPVAHPSDFQTAPPPLDIGGIIMNAMRGTMKMSNDIRDDKIKSQTQQLKMQQAAEDRAYEVGTVRPLEQAMMEARVAKARADATTAARKINVDRQAFDAVTTKHTMDSSLDQRARSTLQNTIPILQKGDDPDATAKAFDDLRFARDSLPDSSPLKDQMSTIMSGLSSVPHVQSAMASRDFKKAYARASGDPFGVPQHVIDRVKTEIPLPEGVTLSSADEDHINGLNSVAAARENRYRAYLANPDKFTGTTQVPKPVLSPSALARIATSSQANPEVKQAAQTNLKQLLPQPSPAIQPDPAPAVDQSQAVDEKRKAGLSFFK